MAITREEVLHVAKLARLDLVNAWRDDEPRPSLGLDDAFANAPQREADLFRVPPTT